MFGGLNLGSFFERPKNEPKEPVDYTKKVIVRAYNTPFGEVTTKTTMDPVSLEDITIPYSGNLQAIEHYRSGKPVTIVSEDIIDKEEEV